MASIDLSFCEELLEAGAVLVSAPTHPLASQVLASGRASFSDGLDSVNSINSRASTSA